MAARRGYPLDNQLKNESRMTLRPYIMGLWSATSQWFNVAVCLGHPNESISGRCYREPWPKMMAFVNWLFSWQKNHCKSAYDNDLKWAKSYIEQDKEVSSRTE